MSAAMLSAIKKCTGCKLTLDTSMFYRNKSRKDRLSERCKSCANQSQTRYVKKLVEKSQLYDQLTKSPTLQIVQSGGCNNLRFRAGDSVVWFGEVGIVETTDQNTATIKFGREILTFSQLTGKHRGIGHAADVIKRKSKRRVTLYRWEYIKVGIDGVVTVKQCADLSSSPPSSELKWTIVPGSDREIEVDG